MSDAAAKKPAHPPAKPGDHPKYTEMVKAAIAALKERNGSSRQAIRKYILANYKVIDNDDTPGPPLRKALKMMSEKGFLVHTKGVGASGSFKLNKAVKEEKPKKKPAAKKVAKKPAAKKTKSPKKAAKSPKKAAKKPAKKTAKKAAKKPAAKKAGKKPAAK